MTDTAAKVVRRPGIFYGWWIVLVASIVLAVNGGLFYYGFGAFFIPLANEFRWSRTTISGAFSLARLENGLAGPISGFLIDRIGPRKMMLFGMSLMGLGFVIFSRIDSVLGLYLVFLLGLALGSSFGAFSPVNTAVANWFIKKRSRVFGITQTGWALGGLAVPLLAWLISAFGWRAAAIVAGLLIWGIGIPSAFLIRHRPEPYGYVADGEAASTNNPKTPEVTKGGLLALRRRLKKDEVEVDFTAGEAIRTSAFWLYTSGVTISYFITGTVTVHQIPYLTDIGLSLDRAALMLAAMTLISIPGRLGFGWLGDALEKRYMLALCLGLESLGLLALANAHSLWQLVPYLLIYSPGYGGSMPLMHALRGEYFGRKAFATIQGLSSLVIMWGTVLGPLFTGYVFDRFGSYRPAFVLLAMLGLVGMALVAVAKRPLKTTA